MPTFRHILHPTDFSRASAAAFARAVELAKANRAGLTIVHVLSPVIPVAGEGYVPPESYEKIEASVRAEAEKHLNRLIGKAKRAGVRASSLLVSGGIPHERIARAAKSRRVDLVVIGTHGRTGLSRFFLGSVAARVIAIAPCPVLTVRGR